jgi:intermediate peptidase
VNNTTLSPYFSLGCCMDGLDQLFRAIYGVSLQYVEAEYGELWSYDVTKLVRETLFASKYTDY